MKRLLLAVAAIASLALIHASVAVAQGPSMAPKDNNNNAWACGTAEGVPAENHCLNVRSQGNTFVLKVFSPDPRWPVEGASTDPKSDLRPCPQDPQADPDGTWWAFAPGLWVCHHRPAS